MLLLLLLFLPPWMGRTHHVYQQLVLQGLLSVHRLVLVLDLDHTLVNSAKFSEVCSTGAAAIFCLLLCMASAAHALEVAASPAAGPADWASPLFNVTSHATQVLCASAAFSLSLYSIASLPMLEQCWGCAYGVHCGSASSCLTSWQVC
jgi:hypothetical protein